ncbi:hypothetical protein DSO57_1030630 [Entomophthora muscae]|uniref:Uncharacterized protein n=1 Tax=Entomophthora muscae TaxID=34485 RepID=A0ACC2S300_9FUNG|nr:hypothetical protein DSO57_1030630 [Entomophthora muscae]
MKFLQQLLAFLVTLAVVALEEEVTLKGEVTLKEQDILGTYKAVGSGRHDYDEIHFGKNEALIKKKKGRNTGSNLVMGHWYTSGKEAVILEGKPGTEDQEIHFKFITKDTIVYHRTTFVRVTEPTDLDTLAMVGYGHYVADNKSSKFKKVIFTEGKMTMEYEVKGDPVYKHGDWKVKTFTINTINGVLIDEASNKEIQVRIVKESEKKLRINRELFTLEEIKDETSQ